MLVFSFCSNRNCYGGNKETWDNCGISYNSVCLVQTFIFVNDEGTRGYIRLFKQFNNARRRGDMGNTRTYQYFKSMQCIFVYFRIIKLIKLIKAV